MSHPALSDLHPAFRPIAEDIFALAAAKGLPLVLCVTHRDDAGQLAAWQQGRELQADGKTWIVTNLGLVVTHAMPGASPHNPSPPLAIDCCPVALVKTPGWSPTSPLWQTYGQCVRDAGAKWGGDFSAGKTDLPHAEHPFWRSVL